MMIYLLLCIAFVQGIIRGPVDEKCSEKYPVWGKPVDDARAGRARCCEKGELVRISYPDFQTIEFLEIQRPRWVKICGVTKSLIWTLNRWETYDINRFVVIRHHLRVPVAPGQLLYVEDCLDRHIFFRTWGKEKQGEGGTTTTPRATGTPHSSTTTARTTTLETTAAATTTIRATRSSSTTKTTSRGPRPTTERTTTREGPRRSTTTVDGATTTTTTTTTRATGTQRHRSTPIDPTGGTTHARRTSRRRISTPASETTETPTVPGTPSRLWVWILIAIAITGVLITCMKCYHRSNSVSLYKRPTECVQMNELVQLPDGEDGEDGWVDLNRHAIHYRRLLNNRE